MSTPPAPRISVVAPVYNEAQVVEELARRCAEAATLEGYGDPEVLIIDDASTDATAATLAEAQIPFVHCATLLRNRGQFGATKAGLRRAASPYVVVIDGDLQDPPEHLGALVARLHADPDLDVVFATKASRDDPLWFRLGRAAYHLLASVPGAPPLPKGAGAYCAMRQATAKRVSLVRTDHANLAAVLVALGARSASVPYAKQARYDATSRVGIFGLVREAWGSMVLTGAATVISWWWAVGLTLGSVLAPKMQVPLLFGAMTLSVAGLIARWAASRSLATPLETA